MSAFKSKIDRSLLFLLAFSIIACLMGASVMLEVGGTFNAILAAVTLIAGAGFPLWILLSTRYIVDDENLKIMSGPFSWIIPIQSIISVQETRSAGASPALSLDRLEIKYGTDKAILVSPADKQAFIRRLGGKAQPDTGRQNRPHAAAKQSNTSTRKKKAKKSTNRDAQP
ncbi:PH domain-containing protein [Nitrosomonas sp. Nm51]|uniref:PH domain-containing protein n=1 Tax=Nitrosomonas sp. Nm51 TaxID=133720 RepID=UPI0008AFA060|nr:PH domain-containing protein [Nitrosomonas sp. Nm51]SER06326.1 PH domain-containing protein [Nitrosomonas sp. Nm51]